MSIGSFLRRGIRAVGSRILERIRRRAQISQTAGQSIDDPLVDRYTRRQGFIITDLVSAALPAGEKFTILDGGAREALSDPRWQALDPKRATLYGFEPDKQEVAELNRITAQRGLDYRYYATGLWGTRSTLPFYENKSPGGSSFYRQNTDFTNRWKFENAKQKFLARDIFYPTATSEWSLTSVADWAADHDIRDIDFMKLNVQGAELEILKGCGKLLDTVTGLMVEISFVESYKERPFFADIDIFLRAQGFMFFDLIGHHYIGRARSPITAYHAPGLHPLFGQLMEGHGIYFRDPIDLEHRGRPVEGYSLTKMLKLAAFAEMFGQNEYAFELLEWILAREKKHGNAAGEALARSIFESAETKYRYIMGGWDQIARAS